MADEKILKTEVFAEINASLEDPSVQVSEDTELVGGGKIIDSMGLVQLCLALEDKASGMGFEFDWASETAMSKSRGMFRTAGALADEFIKQMNAQA